MVSGVIIGRTQWDGAQNLSLSKCKWDTVVMKLPVVLQK